MSRRRMALFLTGLACCLFVMCQQRWGWPLRQTANIGSTKITPESGGAYKISLKNLKLKNPPSRQPRTMVFEDGIPLLLARSSDRVRQGEPGSFSISEKGIWFSARDRSDPRTNGRSYDVILAVSLPMPITVVSILFGLLAMAVAAQPVLQMAWLRGTRLMSGAWRRFSRVALVASAWSVLVRVFTLDWALGNEIPLSFAIARFATGLIFWLLSPMGMPAETLLASAPLSSYDPVGPFCFLCPDAPSSALIDGCRFILPVSSVFLMVGLMSRLSLMVTVFAAWVLGSAPWIYGVICHGFQPFILASLPLLVARSQTWSLDAVIRRRRGLAPLPAAGTRPAVFGMQIMASLVFLSAAAHKIYLGNGQFMRWVFSDSLRNIILLQYSVLGRELPPWLEWVVSHGWVAQILALGAVTCQVVPSLGILFARRPWLRLLCGAAMFAEIRAISVVMGLFPQQSLILCAAFVDWEYFSRCWAEKRITPAAEWVTSPLTVRSLIVAAIASLQAVIGFNWNSIRSLFPFTSFPMYSSVSDTPPYDRHKPFLLYQSTQSFNTTPPASKEQLNFLWTYWYYAPWGFAAQPAKGAANIASHLEATLPLKVHDFTIKAAIREIQAVPLSGIDFKFEANFCQWREGAVRAVGWEWKTTGGDPSVRYSPEGFEVQKVRLAWVGLSDWTLHRIDGEIDPHGGMFPVRRSADDHAAILDKDGCLHLPILPGSPCGWLVFVTEEVGGTETIWSGPLLY